LELAGGIVGTSTPPRAIGPQRMIDLLSLESRFVQMLISKQTPQEQREAYLDARRREIKDWLHLHEDELEAGTLYLGG